MSGKAIINRINLGGSAIEMLTRISWKEGMNGKSILNKINLGRSSIAIFTRI
jgi:hypothetical protein